MVEPRNSAQKQRPGTTPSSEQRYSESCRGWFKGYLVQRLSKDRYL